MAIKIKNRIIVNLHYSIFDFDCHFDFDYFSYYFNFSGHSRTISIKYLCKKFLYRILFSSLNSSHEFAQISTKNAKHILEFEQIKFYFLELKVTNDFFKFSQILFKK